MSQKFCFCSIAMMFQNLHRMMRGAETLKITCACGHAVTWTSAQAFARLGPDAMPFDIRRRLICTVCGRVGVARAWI